MPTPFGLAIADGCNRSVAVGSAESPPANLLEFAEGLAGFSMSEAESRLRIAEGFASLARGFSEVSACGRTHYPLVQPHKRPNTPD